jgi:hypothetical protein
MIGATMESTNGPPWDEAPFRARGVGHHLGARKDTNNSFVTCFAVGPIVPFADNVPTSPVFSAAIIMSRYVYVEGPRHV